MLAAAYRHCANAVSLPWNRERQKTLTVPGKLHRFLGTVVVVCEDILALFIRKEYEMLLTTNASGAITTVAESFFPFAAGSSFVISDYEYEGQPHLDAQHSSVRREQRSFYRVCRHDR